MYEPIRDYEPILQLVHYSDMHIVGPQFLAQQLAFQRMAHQLPVGLRQGVEGHDPGALQDFEIFVRDCVALDREWAGRPVWLVDTGDGTTFGDDDSLNLWLNTWTPRFKFAAAANGVAENRHVCLYGNHDAWPGHHPLVRPASMEQHRDDLRLRPAFNVTLPTAPVTTALDGAGAQVQLYVLNAVDHTLALNVLALGRLTEDRYWLQGPIPTQAPVNQLVQEIARAKVGRSGNDLRILAMHYPVPAAATPTDRATMILSNRKSFGRAMEASGTPNAPLVHMLLGGHTHRAFPVPGQQPQALCSTELPPLARGVVQGIAGSLSQTPLKGYVPMPDAFHPEACEAQYPQKFSVYRIWRRRANAREVLIQRTLIGRPKNGPFAAIPFATKTATGTESTTLTL